MYLPTWLRIVRRRLFGPLPSAARRRKARKASRVRPRLEALEDRLAPASFQTLFNFDGGDDGGEPQAGVIADSNGNLYGTTLAGGVNEAGNVFKYSPITQKVTDLHDFYSKSEDHPIGGLIRDSSGYLYGTTSEGTGSAGTVFRLRSDGSNYQILHTFTGSDGADPETSLIMDGNGNLYGTTKSGGSSDYGTVFRLSPNKSGGYNFTTLYNFSGADDGRFPQSSLLLDSQGNLYGTTELGGNSADGTVYQLSPNGSSGYKLITLHAFSGSDGRYPFSNLLMDSKGNLYGTTLEGSPSNDGTVFQLSPNGKGAYNFFSFFGFDGSDGFEPGGNWLMDSSGNFYGITQLGGPYNDGTVYQLSPNGSGGYNLASLHTFRDTDGAYVLGGLSADSSGNLYGTTDAGGEFSAGTIFELFSVISVGPATSTAAKDATTPFSTNPQSVTLKADVTSSSGIVNEGTVTFTLMQGSTVIGTPITSGTVNGGAASVSYALPANLAAGTYTIDAAYSGGTDFQGSSDETHTLTVSAANVTTTAGSSTAYYSPNPQTVALSAALADNSFSKDKVDEGTVTFTVMNGTAKLGSASGTVQSDGTASADVMLPAGLAAGSYAIDVSYSDKQGNFTDHGDTSATLTINPANVAATANSVSTVYSISNQTVTLSASVTDTSNSKDIVDEGTVLFTVESGGATLGTASGTVTSSGAASTPFTLPAGQPAGSYVIAVHYKDEKGNFSDSSDTSAALTIAPAKATTAGVNASATFRPGAQDVMLTANVSSAAGTVNEGTVTFTLTGSTVIGTPTTSAAVRNGQASVLYNLPAGTPASDYTINVDYTDKNGNFTNSGDVNSTLTLSPALVTTTAVNATAYYSPNQQTLTLLANLADTSFPSDTVDEGTVYFTVMNGAKPLGTVQGTVNSKGAASADFTLPTGQAIGSYTIDVKYRHPSGNFTDSGDTSATLTVFPASVTVTAATPPSVVYSSNAQDMILSATVADITHTGDTVNEGSVIFTIMNGSSAIRSVAGSVTGGLANADFTLPPGQAAGSYTIEVHYNDSPSNFVDSGDKGASLTVNPASVTTTAADASASYSLSSQALLLNATVTNASDPTQAVDKGVVTFTVLNGSMKLGTAQGLVSGGTANAAFTLPAGQAVGSYTIEASYSDSQHNFFESSNKSGTLTVSPVNVADSANNVSAFYSPNSQTVTLSANIANISGSGQPIGEGVVTFTVADKNGNPVGNLVHGNVSGGAASVPFTLPAGQAIGNYTISVRYKDQSGNFIDSGNSSATLTIVPTNVTTTANSVSTGYSLGTQNLALSATVADARIATDTVNEGSVTFTVMEGSTALGSATGSVGGGTAKANFTLPAGQAAGSYTIDVGYSDKSGNFSDGGDTGAALTVSPALVTTAANNAATVYSPNTQTVKLSSSVANTSIAADTVNEGTVNFLLNNGSDTLAKATGLVIAGKVNAALTVPAGLAPGSYSLSTTYSDSQGNFKYGGESPGTLTIGAANVTTTAVAASAVYSPSSQTVTLDATVANSSDSSITVNEGAVTFTLLSGSSILGSAQGTVSGGTARANLALPAGLAAGSYTIAVNYNDSQSNFSDSGDNVATLTVSPANVTTTAVAAGTTFSTMPQTVALHAAVVGRANFKVALPPATPINEGAVTFTLLSGSTVLVSVQGTVSGGTASANLTLPGGLAAGSYSLAVQYSDSQGNFSDNGDNSAMLTIGAAGTTAQLTQLTLAPTYLSLTTTETLTAHVSSSTAVTQGTVTFFVSNHTISANVDGNGNATAVVTLPMLQLLGPQDISVRYNDAANNLTPSTDAQTAAWRIFNPILPSTATFAPNKDSVTADLFGLFITYTNGLLTEIDFGSIQLVFSYNASGQLAQVTWDGMNLLR